MISTKRLRAVAVSISILSSRVCLILVFVSLALFAIMQDKSASSSSAVAYNKNKSGTSAAPLPKNVAQQLTAQRGTKASIVRTIMTLAQAGMINDLDENETNENSLKRALTEASADHGKASGGPHGPLIQYMKIGHPKLDYWEYINPFALLHYMTEKSTAFASMMQSIHTEGVPMRIVIYADSLVPGNPFRPDMGRKLMCIYWAIVDWPQHVLQRSFAWPVFSIIRTSILDDIEGGLGRLMRMMLRVFFGAVGSSFATGVHMCSPRGGYVLTAVFAGFLADLLGHKELTEWKGFNGVYCCLTCGNVLNMLHRSPSNAIEVSANCHVRSRFVIRTNEDVWNAVDELADAKAKVDAKQMALGRFAKLETDKGFNHHPGGLLLDKELRAMYKPVDMMIRDWQHTACQDGVANTHVFNLLNTLQDLCNIPIEQVQAFSQMCKYPSAFGKLDRSAFARQRLRTNTIASFSSIMLTMVTVLMLFIEEKLIADAIPEHVACFRQLYHILGLFRAGPEDSMQFLESLELLISGWLSELVRLYGDYVKPKAHHMFHILDGMAWLGKLLSCFVTERKHKLIKSAAIYVFRHLEHTVLADVLNQQMRQIIMGHDLYADSFLILPRDVNYHGLALRRARAGVLRIGHVERGDVIIMQNGNVGKVVSLWQAVYENRIFLEIDLYPNIHNDDRFRATARESRSYVDGSEVADVCIYIEESPGIIRLTIPAPILYKGL